VKFKLQINGLNLKQVQKVVAKDNGQRPALNNASIEMYDVNNVRMVIANGYFISDVKITAVDMENNPLSEDFPKTWLALPLTIFADNKPQKSKKYYKSHHYEIIVDAEPHENLARPMQGTATILVDNGTMTYQLAKDGVTPNMTYRVMETRQVIDEMSEEQKVEWVKKWNGFITINFNLEYLSTMLEAQRGSEEWDNLQITVDAFAVSMDRNPPMWVNVPTKDKDNHNVGLLMPVLLKDGVYEQNKAYTTERNAQRQDTASKLS
jgi:hypothetical protein